jgi:type III secretion protein L
MTPTRARIIRSPATVGAVVDPLFALRPSGAQRRRIAREELEARLAAERIVHEARLQAETITRHARDEAESAAVQVAHDAREQAEAKVVAQWLAMRQAEGGNLERETERIIHVGVILAERLLGVTLELEPARIADLARAAIAEARGARRIAIEANPLDARALRQHLGAAGLDGQSVEVRENDGLARGELRLQTDVGTIDARLAPRLDRLAAALRDALP